MSAPQKIIVIGGGASGYFAAIQNKTTHPQADVIIIEKSKQVLAKVKISGGGRCNVTHACFEPRQLCSFYPRGNKELLGPFFTFQPQDTMDWFEQRGVALKVEADNRVFPVSNSSQSIMNALQDEVDTLGISVWTECGVLQVDKQGTHFTLALDNDTSLTCDKLILATGSSKAGYALAKSLGHTITPLIPSLFTFKIKDEALHKLSGLSVQDATVWLDGKEKDSQSGPVLITHWGLSGPGIIKLSAWQAVHLKNAHYSTPLFINWLPQLTSTQCLERLTQLKEKSPQKTITNQSPFSEIPGRLWHYLAQKGGVLPDQKWKQLQPKALQALAKTLLSATVQVSGKGVFKEEFVTCGGVSLKEINFKTMESKVCPNLHIVGELLDIDGVTGGFNFQNAWTTGYLSA